MKRKIALLLAKIDLSGIEILEERQIEKLPEAVQKYLRFTKSPGKPKVKTVKLKQQGLFNIKGKKWASMKAVQYFNVEGKEFIWKARSGMFSVTDQFIQNEGSLVVKILHFLKIAEVKGKQMDQGEILRFLTEMIWFPPAFASDYIQWEVIDSTTSKATILYGDKQASANFYFKSTGELVKISAKRYRETMGSFELNDWEISKLEYKEFNDLLIPYRAEVSWKIENVILPYYKLEITDIKYNDNSPY